MCQQRNHKSIESLEQSLDRINGWIGNCDQKAGFLLAILGVLIPIVFTSDISERINEILLSPYKAYREMPNLYEFNAVRFVYFVLLVATIIACMISIISVLLSITANITTKEFKKMHGNEQLIETSFLFFGSIKKMTYAAFREMSDANYEDDLKSQIFVNSSICTRKFKFYNIGLYAFIVMAVCFIALFILNLFV